MILTYQEKEYAKSIYDLESAQEEVKDCKKAVEHVNAQLMRANADLVLAEKRYEMHKRTLNAPAPEPETQTVGA